MPGIGSVRINNKTYNIAPTTQPYLVSEVPTHPDVDPKLERRVIYRDFGKGIQPRSEEPSVDATAFGSAGYSVLRHSKLVGGYYWANGTDTRLQDRIFAQRATTTNTVGNAPSLIGDASVYSWAICSDRILVLDPTTDLWVTSATSLTGTVKDAIQFGGYLYVAMGNNNFYTWDQTTTTTNWTNANNPVANYFTVIRNQLWRADATPGAQANIYSTTDTTPGVGQNWSTATVIGDPTMPITALDVFQDFIIIFKQDGIWSADKTGNVYPVFPGFKNLGQNPRPIGQWQDAYYFASDYGLIWQYQSKGGVTKIGFDKNEPYPMGGNNWGIPNAVGRGVATTNFFYVAFNQYPATSTRDGFVLAWDGDSWHATEHFSGDGTDMTALGMTSKHLTNNPRLQYAKSTGGTYQIQTQTAPLIDPFLASSYDTASGVMYLTSDNGGLEDEWKVLEKVTIWTDNPRAGAVSIAYAIDEDIKNLVYQDMGTPDGFNSTPAQTFHPPTPLPTYRKINLRITIQATSSTVSPQVRYAVMHYKQREPQKKVWDLTLLAAQNTPSAQGRIDTRTVSAILKDLDLARRTHQQVEFVDVLGARYQVYLDQVDQDVVVLKGTQLPNFTIKVKLVEAAWEDPTSP